MSIIKITKHINNFVIIQKTTLHLPELSWKSKGLWAYLMSLPCDWNINVKHLTSVFPGGKDMIWAMLRELEKFGLCRKIQRRNECGQIQGIDYEVFEEPVNIEDVGKVAPHTEKPCTGKPSSVNPTHTKKQEELRTEPTNKEEVSKDTSSRSRKSAPRVRPPDIVFSKEERRFENIEEADRSQWMVAYPDIDLDKELAKMVIWLESSPRKANKRNWRRFISSWLSRASDSALNREVRSQASKMSQEPDSYEKINTKSFYEWKAQANGALDHCYVKNGYLINNRNKREVRVNLKPEAFEALLCEVAGVRRKSV